MNDWYRFLASNKRFVQLSSKIFEDLRCNSALKRKISAKLREPEPVPRQHQLLAEEWRVWEPQLLCQSKSFRQSWPRDFSKRCSSNRSKCYLHPRKLHIRTDIRTEGAYLICFYHTFSRTVVYEIDNINNFQSLYTAKSFINCKLIKIIINSSVNY